jgi:hypothetical protein
MYNPDMRLPSLLCTAIVCTCCSGGGGPSGDISTEDSQGVDDGIEVVEDGDDIARDDDDADEFDVPEAMDAAPDWTFFDGEVPDLPHVAKDEHVTSCMRTRACSSSPQQLGTCTVAYAHVQGRMIGIVLGSVAHCVATSEPDCDAITDCLTNGEGPTSCEPLVTADRCDGSVLRQCSRASGIDLVIDCGALGLGCYIDSTATATCGLGICDPSTFRSDCHGDDLVVCEYGVIVVAQCDTAGLACVQEAGGSGWCAGGGAPCTDAEDPRRCEGDRIMGCIGGTTANVDCASVVQRWTCGPREGTFGCVPSGDECTADPLFGTDLDESCAGDEVLFCMDGWVTGLACADYGLSACTDLGSAARCTPP